MINNVVLGFLLGLLLPMMAVLPQHAESVEKKPKLKILFMVKKFPYPMQTFFINQVKGLLDRGHEVIILAQKQLDYAMPSDLAGYDLSQRVFYNDLPVHHRTFDIIYCALHRTVKHCLALQKNRGLSGKIVIGFHGAEGELSWPGYREKFQNIFNTGDYILPACSYAKDWLISLGCNPQKISVLRVTVDSSRFPYKNRKIIPDEPIRIVTTARLIELKGIEYAINAVAQLLKKYPTLEYLIIGTGPWQKRLQELIDTLQVVGKVKLVGFKKQEEVAALLDTAHLFILSSITLPNSFPESSPNAIKEAMLSGLPVICTRHGGIPELVEDKVSGLLVPERDAITLAQRIEYLITHPEDALSMGKMGSKTVRECFDRETENDKLVEIFWRVVRGVA